MWRNGNSRDLSMTGHGCTIRGVSHRIKSGYAKIYLYVTGSLNCMGTRAG